MCESSQPAYTSHYLPIEPCEIDSVEASVKCSGVRLVTIARNCMASPIVMRGLIGAVWAGDSPEPV
jgi:hypothetical protein